MASRKSKRKAPQGKKQAPAAAAREGSKKAVAAKSSEAAAATSAKSVKASKAALKKTDAKPKTKASVKASKAKRNRKPNIFTRFKRYVGSIRTEMRRVTWPTKKELINYSVTVCASLVVVGVVIALLDSVIGQSLVLFSGLRG